MNIYISPQGNNCWTGRLKEPNATLTDGPLKDFSALRRIIGNIRENDVFLDTIHVFVREGIYFLQEPILITYDVFNNVCISAYEDEEVIISGGIRLDNFKEEIINGIKMWTTIIEDVKNGEWYFNQLFVNGERRNRPCTKMLRIKSIPHHYRNKKGTNTFECYEGDVRNFRNLSDCQVIVNHKWIGERINIKEFDDSYNIVHLQYESRAPLIEGTDKEDDYIYSQYYIENVFEELNKCGEWYLDRETGKLYYIPLEGEEINNCAIIAPMSTCAIKLLGDKDTNEYVENISFKRLSFKYFEFEDCRERQFNFPAQGAIHINGIIEMNYARYCKFEDCTFKHLGSYAIEMKDGCKYNLIRRNVFEDLGAGGIKIGDPIGNIVPDGVLCGYNDISYNRFCDGGRIFTSAIGIIITYGRNNVIRHNEIENFEYSGISIGWVWGYGKSVTCNNKILKNYIHHIGTGKLSDMGGIYTLGVQPGTVISNNLIHDVKKAKYGGWGIYLDEGSSDILVEKNICYNLASHAFNQHYGRENIVRNNIFAFGDEGIFSITRDDGNHQFTLERNILISNNALYFAWRYGAYPNQKCFSSDNNIIYNINRKEIYSYKLKGYDDKGKHIIGEKHNLNSLQKMGYDKNSIFTDPLFENIENFDFRLRENSPALDIGFENIDISDVGICQSEKC